MEPHVNPEDSTEKKNTSKPKKATNETHITFNRIAFFNAITAIIGILLLVIEVYQIMQNDPLHIGSWTIVFITIVMFTLLFLILNSRYLRGMRDEISNSLISLSKHLLSGPGMSLILTIVGSYIIYNLTQYQSREKIAIEGVIVKPKAVNVKIDADLWTQLKQIAALGNNYFLTRSEANQKENTEIVANNFVLNNDQLLKYLEMLKNKANEVSKQRNMLDQKAEDLDSSDFLIEKGLYILPQYSSKYENAIAKVYDENDYTIDRKKLENEYNAINATLRNGMTQTEEKINAVLQRLITTIDTQIDPDNCDFELEVLVTNLGGTQSVIRYKALLILKDKNEQQVTLNRSPQTSNGAPTGQSSNYVVVEPMGFQNLNLRLENESVVNTNSNIQSVLKAHDLQKGAQLVLFDVHNKKLEPYDFDLQNDLEADPNRALKKFIDEYRGHAL